MAACSCDCQIPANRYALCVQALVPLIARRFGNPGDVSAAQAMVEASNGIQRTREMAAEHAAAAVAAVSAVCTFPLKWRRSADDVCTSQLAWQLSACA